MIFSFLFNVIFDCDIMIDMEGIIMTLDIFYSYILTVIMGIILTPIASKIGDCTDIVAKENNRTIHHGRIARMGGLAIYISFMIGCCVFLKADRQINAILIAGFIIFMTGFIDDMVDLKPKVKLLGQFIAASIVIFYGDMYIHDIFIPFLPDNQILSTIVTYGWIIGVTNAINLIDGLDGLCAGITSIVLVVIAFTAVAYQRLDISAISILLAGSISGFLCYNFHPASIFMGDCGALFIGFMISVISILGFGSESSVFFTLGAPIVMLALPIMDTLIAIVRRKLKHRRFDEADKEHLHHTLVFKLDMGQTRSVIILYMATILFAMSSFIYIYNQRLGIALFIILAVAFELFVEYTQIISVHYRPVLATLNIFIKSTSLPMFSRQRAHMRYMKQMEAFNLSQLSDDELLLESERLKMRKQKTKNKIVAAFVVVGIIVVMIAGSFFFKSQNETPLPDQPVIPEQEIIPYKMDPDATDYLKAMYNQLNIEVKNKNDEAIRKLVASYFATDFFTWTNKSNREDVGGLAYVLPDARIDFAKYATNFYYVNFDEHKQTYGQKGLPEVVSCTVNDVSASNFVYAKTGNDNSWDVNLTIAYDEESEMPTEALMTDFTVTLLLENDVYYVVGIDYTEISGE